MTDHNEHAYDALEKIFHEPNRLAIMSLLAGAAEGVTFTELRDECRLTDGNLNRHLKVLEEARVVRVKKAFVAAKPQTTAHITSLGLERFTAYLEALSKVLKTAQKAVVPEKQKDRVGVVSAARVRA